MKNKVCHVNLNRIIAQGDCADSYQTTWTQTSCKDDNVLLRNLNSIDYIP